jgi:hypothetical protein
MKYILLIYEILKWSVIVGFVLMVIILIVLSIIVFLNRPGESEEKAYRESLYKKIHDGIIK